MFIVMVTQRSLGHPVVEFEQDCLVARCNQVMDAY
jgi:hypothetical protein